MSPYTLYNLLIAGEGDMYSLKALSLFHDHRIMYKQ